MHRLIAAPFWLIAAVILAVGCRPGEAQVSPSTDQIEMFRNLTPDQQEALLRALGGSAGASGGLSTSGALGAQFPDRQSQEQQRGNNRSGLAGPDEERSSPDEEQQPRIPVMKSEDWVVVEIDFHLPPPPPPPHPPGPPPCASRHSTGNRA